MYIKNYINVYIFIYIFIFIYNDASSPEKQILGSVLRASRCLSFEMRVSFVSLAFSLSFSHILSLSFSFLTYYMHHAHTRTHTHTRARTRIRSLALFVLYSVGGSIKKKKEGKKKMARSEKFLLEMKRIFVPSRLKSTGSTWVGFSCQSINLDRVRVRVNVSKLE